jgi:hypothetical protein
VSLHTFYGGSLDDLIVDAVAPVVARLEAEGDLRRWFFLRYWEGGVHLRLRLLPAEGAGDRVDDVARSVLQAHVSEHPSPAGSGLTDYASLAVALAAQEHRSEYERQARPMDTVAAVPYVPETDVYGEGRALAVVERHFEESSLIALGALQARLGAEQRRALALEVVLRSLALLEPDLDRLARGFASGADLAMRRYAQFPGAQALADAYDRGRDEIADLVARAWAQPGPGESPAARWVDSARELVSAWQPASPASGAIQEQLARSSLAWHLYAMPAAVRPVGGVLLRCTHLLNNRIGVPLQDELRIGYVAARALSDRATSGKVNAR